MAGTEAGPTAPFLKYPLRVGINPAFFVLVIPESDEVGISGIHKQEPPPYKKLDLTYESTGDTLYIQCSTLEGRITNDQEIDKTWQQSGSSD